MHELYERGLDMQCFVCKEEITDKRRKKCPICGSKLSLSKYDNHLFEWLDADINHINDLKLKAVNNSAENSSTSKNTKSQGETTNNKSQSNSSGKKQVDPAKEEYKKKSSEKRAADRKKREERKNDTKYGLQLFAGGAACALILGYNFDTMSLVSIIITFAGALFFLLGASLMLFGPKDK